MLNAEYIVLPFQSIPKLFHNLLQKKKKSMYVMYKDVNGKI